MINIIPTKHILEQVQKRVKRIKTIEEAKEYIIDKFSRMILGDKIGRKGQGETKQDVTNDKLIVFNNLHRIIYKRKGLDFILVTYYLNTNKNQ